MKNEFWKRQVLCGYVVELDNISSMYGGIDPVANWQGGYTAYFSIDNYDSGFVSVDICGDMAKVGVACGVDKSSVLVREILGLCFYNPPRIGDIFDNPHAWG